MDKLKWIYSVPGRSKFYIFLLMILQTASGAVGVFYALFMKDIVDNAVAGDKRGFICSIIRIVVLILINIIFYILMPEQHSRTGLREGSSIIS